MVNVILVLVLLCMAGAAGFYLYRAKKRGESCIGCPYSKQCGGKCGGSCGGSNHKAK